MHLQRYSAITEHGSGAIRPPTHRGAGKFQRPSVGPRLKVWTRRKNGSSATDARRKRFKCGAIQEVRLDPADDVRRSCKNSQNLQTLQNIVLQISHKIKFS